MSGGLNVRNSWYENDTPCIAAHQQPTVLIDMALTRGIDSHRLLRGAGFFYEDILHGKLRLTPRQCYQLMANSRRLMDSNDTSFLAGQRLFPGNGGPVSTALLNARDLQQALEFLVRYRPVLSPLLAPRLFVDQEFIYVYWQDACGAGEQLIFLVEMMSSALTALCRWLSGRKLPWQYYFAHPRPTYIEQYQVHLGENLHFASHMNAMVIARTEIHQPWPNASPSAALIAEREADNLMDASSQADGFLQYVYQHLLSRIQSNPNLEQLAVELGMSSATLKRKLSKHGTTFQAIYDLVRKQLALYLLHREGWTSEQVANHLHFHDANNLRRAFKRWTGATPASLNPFFSLYL